ncbi:MAG: phage tail protein [Methylovulum sp.]|nr:phage tail protein [Methylovulum sp.]
METFAWKTPNATLNEEPRVLSAQFGDGYSQESEDGLNAVLQVWDLVFDDVDSWTAIAIRDFLRARKRVERFLFVTLLNDTITVRCRKWEVKPAKNGRLTVTTTFIETP